MRKPQPYHLEQCPTSRGQNQVFLDVWLVCDEEGLEDSKDIGIGTSHDVFLRPRNARALGRRLLAMADWLERR